jgi:hypothetical protein
MRANYIELCQKGDYNNTIQFYVNEELLLPLSFFGKEFNDELVICNIYRLSQDYLRIVHIDSNHKMLQNNILYSTFFNMFIERYNSKMQRCFIYKREV